MPHLELTEQEWQTLTVILADVPWKIANPILFKMAHQARDQMAPPTAFDLAPAAAAQAAMDLPPPIVRPDGAGKPRGKENRS